MPNYSQAGRSLQITTPLGEDVLLLVGFRGTESISQLFRFELDLLAEVNTPIAFEDLLGQTVTVKLQLPNEDIRYFNGIVKRFSQGLSDDIFTTYHAEVVPSPWLLTKTVQSQIFQNLMVSDILNQVLSDYEVTLSLTDTYYPRNYCVQYRESDFDFISRLMEDEGIYYYFQHSDGAHTMMVSDSDAAYPDLPGLSTIIFEQVHDGVGEDMRVRTWVKAQELCSTQYTVADYSFEMPTANLQETNPILDQVQVGTVTHQLNLAGSDAEIYDYPGGYAKRYDAVSSQGNSYAQGFTQIFNDRTRIAGVRMEEEECQSLEITGTSDCGNFTAGYAFSLEGHPNGDDQYLLTRVEHTAKLSGYRTGEKDEFNYENRFACMPTSLSFRPRRVTPKPVIAGPQTATVTGQPGDTSSGQSVYCDPYGRVKVQFHWDRQGQMDSNSSCWLRVGQLWAGSGWGAFFWPRTSHEVVVVFEDGDPDKPLIVGSVYNASNMPPFGLPANSALGGIRSASLSGTSGKNFNGVVFNDTSGTEHLAIHSENNMSLNSEGHKQFQGGGNKGERVSGNAVFTVGGIPANLTGGSGGGPGSTSPSGGGTGGGPPPPPGSVSPASLSLGSQNVGAMSGSQTVVFTNNGTSNLNITGFALSDTTDFAQTNDYEGTLPPGGTCTISVTFTPGSTGALSGTLTLTDDSSPANTYTVALSGTGTQGAGVISLSPSSLTFTDQDCNTQSAAQSVTLTNTGNSPLTNFSVELTGTNATDFAQTNACGNSVLAGSNCTINVTYNPGSAGSSSATLIVTDSSNNQYTVDLSGTGVAAVTGPWSAGNTMEYEPSTSYGGQYAEAIFGQAFEVVVGTNYNLYLGGTTSCTIDPVQAAVNFFPALSAPAMVLGTIISTTGGASTFTVGDTTSFSLGNNTNITLTPAQGGNSFTYTAYFNKCIVIDVLAGLLVLLSIMWAMMYAAFQQVQKDAAGNSVANAQDDSTIITLVGACQGIAQALQMAIVIAGGVYAAAQQVEVLTADGQVVAVPAPEAEATNAATEATNAASEADAAAKEATAATKEADAATKEADTATKESDTATKEADKATKEADTAAKEADTATKESDTATKDADKATKDADKAAKESDDAAKEAEKASQEADDAVKDSKEANQEAEEASKEADAKEAKAAETKDPQDVKDAKAAREKANEKTDEAKAKAKEADAKSKEADAKSKEADTKSKEAEAKDKEAKAKEKEAKEKEKEVEPKKKEAEDKKQEAADKDKEAKAKEKEAKTKEQEAKTKEQQAKSAEAKSKTAANKAKALKAKSDRLKAQVEAKKPINSFRQKLASKMGVGKDGKIAMPATKL